MNAADCLPRGLACARTALAAAALAVACAPGAPASPRAAVFDPVPIALGQLPPYDDLLPLGVSADGRAIFEGRSHELFMLIDVLLVEPSGAYTILVKDRHEEGFPDVFLRASLGDGRFVADLGLPGQTATQRVFLNEAGGIDPGGAMCGELESEDGRELLLELVEVSADGRSAVFGIPVEPRSAPLGTVELFAPTEQPRFEDLRICADGRSEPLTPPSPEARLFGLTPGGAPLWRTEIPYGEADTNSFWYGAHHFDKTLLKGFSADGHVLVCLPPAPDPDDGRSGRQCQNAVMSLDGGDPFLLPTTKLVVTVDQHKAIPYQNWFRMESGPLALGAHMPNVSEAKGGVRMAWTPETGALPLHEVVAYEAGRDRALFRALRSGEEVWPFAQLALTSVDSGEMLVCLDDCSAAYVLKPRQPPTLQP